MSDGGERGDGNAMGDSVLVAGLVAFGIVVLRVLAMLIHTRDDAD